MSLGGLLLLLGFITWTVQTQKQVQPVAVSSPLSGATAGSSVTTLSNGLVLYYPLDENAGTIAGDTSGNGYNGTLVNGPVWALGKTNFGVQLDGVDDYINTGVDDPLDLTGTMSVSMWVFRNSASAVHHIISKNENGVASPYQLAILTNNKLRSFTKIPGSGSAFEQMIDSTNTVPLNAWTHIAFVRDSATQRLTFYINGVQDAGGWKTYNPARIVSSGVTTKIASRGDAGSNFLPGKTDEVRIYNRALTPAEVLALYDSVEPTQPTNLAASPISPTQVDLSWTASTDNVGVIGYYIYRDNVQIGSTTTATYSDTTVTNSTLYSYYVVAYDNAGNTSQSSAPSTVTTPAPTQDTTPPVISGINPGSISTTQANINWTTDEPADSQVEYGTSTAYGSISPLNVSQATTHQVVLNSLTPSTLYHYRVISSDANGNQAVSGDNLFTTAAPPVATNGLLGHWAFDEGSGTTTADSTGNNSPGTLANGPLWGTGLMGQALTFDGKNDYVNTNADDSLDVTGSLTLSAWVFRSNSAKTHAIVSKYQTNSSAPFHLELLASGLVRATHRSGTLGQSISSTTAVTNNVWTHVVFVRDNSTGKLTFYFNGVQDFAGWKSYNTTRVAASTVSVKIGSHAGATNNFFAGTIDDVRIYDKALTEAEVQSLYNSHTGDVTPPSSVTIDQPLPSSTVLSNVNVIVSAADANGISKVELYKNGALYRTDVVAPFEFVWSTALENNGVVNLFAKAYDMSGNSATSATSAVTVSNPTASKPNIVLILTDDQRSDTLQYMPILQSRLADAVKFDNAFNAVPLCCPDRSSLLSGQYGHNHKVYDNDPPTGGAPKFIDTSTVATWLKGSGYRTGLFGKYLNSYNLISPYIPPGWDDWHAFTQNNNNYFSYTLNENGVINTYGANPADYSTDVVAGKANQFIQSTPAGQPVFVYLTPFAPHSDAGSYASWPKPAPQDDGTFAGLPNWRPPSYNETDVSDKPTWVKNLPLFTQADMDGGDVHRQKQIESLQAVDRAIGQLLDTLTQTGRLDNTVFIFTSDNGQTWGEHRWMNKKWCAYEVCMKQPLWIKMPGVAGRNESKIVNMVDIAPTLAQLAGAVPASKIDGLSMVDLINDPSVAWKDESLTEYLGAYPFNNNSIFRQVRSGNYSYVEYANGDREFYDLVADPYQMSNAVNNPAYASVVAELKKRLDVLRVQ